MASAAYYVIDVKIHDPEGMKPYQAKVIETIKNFGGRLVIAGGQIERLEGNAPQGIIVMVQFDSMTQARAWHDSSEYQAIIGFRQASSDGHSYLVEGVTA